jgi:hypothetical protein
MALNMQQQVTVLNEIVVPVMQSVKYEHCLFQQDGAPPHYAIAVREILDRELSNRWVGRRGPKDGQPALPISQPVIIGCGDI